VTVHVTLRKHLRRSNFFDEHASHVHFRAGNAEETDRSSGFHEAGKSKCIQAVLLRIKKTGKKERRKEGRCRKTGKKGGRKEGEGRKGGEGKKERRNEGRKEKKKEGRNVKQGREVEEGEGRKVKEGREEIYVYKIDR
jgi:hypothetical protein